MRKTLVKKTVGPDGTAKLWETPTGYVLTFKTFDSGLASRVEGLVTSALKREGPTIPWYRRWWARMKELGKGHGKGDYTQARGVLPQPHLKSPEERIRESRGGNP